MKPLPTIISALFLVYAATALIDLFALPSQPWRSFIDQFDRHRTQAPGQNAEYIHPTRRASCSIEGSLVRPSSVGEHYSHLRHRPRFETSKTAATSTDDAASSFTCPAYADTADNLPSSTPSSPPTLTPYTSYFSEQQLLRWNFGANDFLSRLFEGHFNYEWRDGNFPITPLQTSPSHTSLPVCDSQRLKSLELRMVGDWTLRDGWEPLYSPRECHLKPIRSIPQPCLKGQRWLFLGDSLMRFQFLNLMHFITHGEWVFPSTRSPDGPSLAQDKEYGPGGEGGGWIAFRLRCQQILHPYLTLDRIRSVEAEDPNCYGCIWRYKHPEMEFEAVFLFVPGIAPKSGMTPQGPIAFNFTALRSVMNEIGFGDARLGDPTKVIFNVGVWDILGVCIDGWGMPGWKTLLEQTTAFLQGWHTHFPGVSLIWRASGWSMRPTSDCYANTNENRGHVNLVYQEYENLVKSLVGQYGHGYIDANAVTKELIAHHGVNAASDLIHFQGFIYSVWNTLFLTRQCGLS